MEAVREVAGPGLEISGADLQAIEEIRTRIEALLPAVTGTCGVYAERTGSGFFLDIEWDREALAFHGLGLEEAQAVVQSAIGGENVTTTVEGRERYPVNVRYFRDYREDLDALGRILVPVGGRPETDSHRAADCMAAALMFDRRSPRDYDVENNPQTGDAMKTIQMTIDEPLLEEVDRVIRDLGTTRSSFIRSALQLAIRQHAISRLERQHAEGYATQPLKAEETEIWEPEQVWGEP